MARPDCSLDWSILRGSRGFRQRIWKLGQTGIAKLSICQVWEVLEPWGWRHKSCGAFCCSLPLCSALADYQTVRNQAKWFCGWGKLRSPSPPPGPAVQLNRASVSRSLVPGWALSLPISAATPHSCTSWDSSRMLFRKFIFLVRWHFVSWVVSSLLCHLTIRSHPSAVFTLESPALQGHRSTSLIFQSCLGFCYHFQHDFEQHKNERERWKKKNYKHLFF